MSLEPTLVELTARCVAGVALRTSAARVADDAPELLRRAAREGVLDATLGRALYIVHAEHHRRDFLGECTLLIAAEYDFSRTVPDSYRTLELRAGRYARFVADGDAALAVPPVWRYIASEWPGRERRAALPAFEMHGVRGSCTADIYVPVEA